MKRDDFSNNFFRFSIQAHSRTYDYSSPNDWNRKCADRSCEFQISLNALISSYNLFKGRFISPSLASYKFYNENPNYLGKGCSLFPAVANVKNAV